VIVASKWGTCSRGKKLLPDIHFRKETPALFARGNACIAILRQLSTGSVCRRIVAGLHPEQKPQAV